MNRACRYGIQLIEMTASRPMHLPAIAGACSAVPVWQAAASTSFAAPNQGHPRR
jgi:hypothetical protein